MLLTRQPISLGEFFTAPASSCGALVSFVGVVRNRHRGRAVRSLLYECYVPMAEKMLAGIVAEAKERWPVDEVRVLHRVGPLEVGEAAVAIAVTSGHRDEAFAACRFVIEEIKHRVPIWKKEFYEDGTAEWTACAHAELAR